jgi:hypothetical protein
MVPILIDGSEAAPDEDDTAAAGRMTSGMPVNSSFFSKFSSP